MTTETAGMRPQAKEGRQLPGAGRGRNGFSLQPSEEVRPYQSPDLGQVMLI